MLIPSRSASASISILAAEGTSGDDEVLRSTARSLHVADTGPAGQLISIMLDPDDADAADANTERWTSATGCLAFRVIPKAPAAALASFLGIIVGWSTTASDLTAVNALMATLDTGISTPGSGGTEVTNTTVILPLIQAGGVTGFTPSPGWIFAADGERIKTIAVRSVGANWVAGVLLQVVT